GYYSLGHVTSSDLLSWTRDTPDDEILTDATYSAGVLFPRVFKDGANWHMLFTALGATNDTKYATSSDGLTWTDQGVVISGLPWGGPIWKEGNTFYFYIGKNTASALVGDWQTSYVSETGTEDIFLYSTNDFSIFVEVKKIVSISPLLRFGLRPSSIKVNDSVSGKDFLMYLFKKNESQEVIVAETRTESFSGSGIAIVNPGSSMGTIDKMNKKLYPSIIQDIYPTIDPLTSVVGGKVGVRTGTEDNRMYKCNYFDAGESVKYNNWSISDPKNFGLKMKVTWSDTVALQYFANILSATNSEKVFNFYQNVTKLRLELYSSAGDGSVKIYRSSNDFFASANFPVLANAAPGADFPTWTLDIGFLWMENGASGILQLCVGYDTNITLVKDQDDSFTDIQTLSPSRISFMVNFSPLKTPFIAPCKASSKADMVNRPAWDVTFLIVVA
ncbi:hypothetical protein LCGC14_2673080, partial [marine sediment metagenome]